VKFPVDAPRFRVVRALESLGFEIIREREHIAMIRRNIDGTTTPLTMPNHPRIKSSTLPSICSQAGIDRDGCAFSPSRRPQARIGPHHDDDGRRSSRGRRHVRSRRTDAGPMLVRRDGGGPAGGTPAFLGGTVVRRP